MALTGVLATLVLCPDHSLAGWLTFAPKETPPPSNNHDQDDSLANEDDGDDRSIDFLIEEKLAWEFNTLPASSMDVSCHLLDIPRTRRTARVVLPAG